MGRPEKQIDPKTPRHRAHLAMFLRAVREAGDMTYAEMAAVVDVSEATLKRAASGEIVAKKETVLAFLVACETKVKFSQSVRDGVVRTWQRARREERGTLHLRAPRPEYIADFRDLSKALEALYESAGAPPLRTVRADSGDPLALPLSTLARIVRRESLPVDDRQLMAFVHGCGAGDQDDKKWQEAWEKLHTITATIENEFDVLVD